MAKRTLLQALALSLLISNIHTAEAETASLYERLGGHPTVQAIADDVIDDAAHDPKLKRSFAKVNLARVKRLLAEKICEVTGGGCQYSEDSMHDVHAGLGITLGPKTFCHQALFGQAGAACPVRQARRGRAGL